MKLLLNSTISISYSDVVNIEHQVCIKVFEQSLA